VDESASCPAGRGRRTWPLLECAGGCMRSSPRLLAPLEQLYREVDWIARADRDAIRFPLRYKDPADCEIVALFAACLAYGRVDLFSPWVEWVLERMEDSPARFVLGFDLDAQGHAF